MRVTLPSVFRTSLPEKVEGSEKVSAPISEEYVEAVVPATPFDLLDSTTGADLAAEFAAKRLAADEAICRDALIFLKAELGLSQDDVVQMIWMRRGADLGASKAKIEAAVKTAAKLLAKENHETIK